MLDQPLSVQVFVNKRISGWHFFDLAICVVQREGIKSSIRSDITTDLDDAVVNFPMRFLFEKVLATRRMLLRLTRWPIKWHKA